jgi:hypothetical protein
VADQNRVTIPKFDEKSLVTRRLEVIFERSNYCSRSRHKHTGSAIRKGLRDLLETRHVPDDRRRGFGFAGFDSKLN